MKKIYKSIALIAILAFAFTASAKDNLNTNSNPNDLNSFSIIKRHRDDNDNGIKHKLILEVGVGLNASPLNYRLRYDLSPINNNNVNGYSYAYSINSVRSIPMINVMADFGLSRRFSVGAAFGYQATVVNWTDDNTGLKYSDNWTRIHAAVRGDYWIVAKDNLGLYTGVKFGVNKYTMVSSSATSVDPNYISNAGITFSPVSAQIHIGFSYWFAKVVGINAEFGIGFGGPYIGAIGITAKIL